MNNVLLIAAVAGIAWLIFIDPNRKKDCGCSKPAGNKTDAGTNTGIVPPPANKDDQAIKDANQPTLSFAGIDNTWFADY